MMKVKKVKNIIIISRAQDVSLILKTKIRAIPRATSKTLSETDKNNEAGTKYSKNGAKS